LANLTISDVSVEQLIDMGDGLLAGGKRDLAEKIYALALSRASAAQRQSLTLRQGIAASPTRPEMNLSLLRTLEDDIGSRNLAFVGAGLATWFKTLPFMLDARFMEISDRHAHLLPLANWQWNLSTALWAVQQARDVPGDYVELGVFKGHTTLFCAEYVGFGDWPKRWWLYDTFEGIPKDQADPGREHLTVAAYGEAFSFEEVRDRFAPYGNIDVVQGRVPEVLAETSPAAISLMHIDLNNATAEIAALDTLYPRLSPGGVIVFDDYGWSSSHNQARAEAEWFKSRGLAIFSLPSGQGLHVKPPA
jgi:O-methyltransferase